LRQCTSKFVFRAPIWAQNKHKNAAKVAVFTATLAHFGRIVYFAKCGLQNFEKVYFAERSACEIPQNTAQITDRPSQ